MLARVRLPLAVAGAALIATVAGSGAIAAPQRPAETGSFAFEIQLAVSYPPVACAPGVPSSFECFARAGRGIVRGLGRLDETYGYLVDDAAAGCGADQVRVVPTALRLTVVGKGEIQIHTAGTGCVTRLPPAPLRTEEPFTITGGSGSYAGASGGGTLASVSYGPPDFGGRDTLTGTLVVPGLDFDVTAPTLSGAASKTVRAPKGKRRVRVAYTVTATDDKDGAVPVTCDVRSRAWFPLGRTRVRCTADDTSGNRGNATFTVTVRRGG